ARDQRVSLSAAVRKDGRVLGLRATVLSNVGAYAIRPHGPLLDPLTCAGLIPGPYDIRDYEYDSYALVTNRCPEGPYRGVGMVTAVLAHERLMDLVAARLNIDPAEVRRRNLVGPAQMPYASATGQGGHTTFAQIAAAQVGVDPATVIVEQTDTGIVAGGTGSFQSRSSVTAATSADRAAKQLRQEIIDAASWRLDQPADRLSIR